MSRPTQETEESARAAVKELERELQTWMGTGNWGEAWVKVIWKRGQITTFKIGSERYKQPNI